MTFAPPTIKEVRVLLKGQDADLSDVELGITGGPGHITTGTSYHLGADQLKMWKDPYSARTSRDLAGLSDAASAIDIDDDLDELRELSVWLVEQCRKGAKDTPDIREIIYSPDGILVLQWDRERGVASPPRPHPDLSHRTHTHVSWYRDSEFRTKTPVFQRFYDERNDMTQPLGELYRPSRWGTYPDGKQRAPDQHIMDLALAVLFDKLAVPFTFPDGSVQTESFLGGILRDILAEVREVRQLLESGGVPPADIRAAVRAELDATKLAPGNRL